VGSGIFWLAMLGLWLEDERLTLREDLPVPSPGDGEVRVSLIQAGICATDHGLVAGMYPFSGVLGHEFVGVVEEGPPDLRGQRVVGEINAVCHECVHCLGGRPRHCANRTVLGIVGRHGAFAESLVLPAENLHTVPSGVSNEEAVFVEPLAAALEILEQVSVRPGDRVLVVGDGRLGQLVAQTVALTGCDLAVSGRHAHKLRFLEERGVSTLDATAADGAGEVEAGAYDLAVECTGNETGYTAARAALRPQGTLVLKSTYPGNLSLNATMLVVDEIRVLGSRCGPFPPALRLLEQGLVDVSYLIDASFPLAQGLAAFAESARRATLKVTLHP